LRPKKKEVEDLTERYYKKIASMKEQLKKELEIKEQVHTTNIEAMTLMRNELITEKNTIEGEVALLQEDLTHGAFCKVMSWLPVTNIGTKLYDLTQEDTIRNRFNKILNRNVKAD
jgi:hypothetical protein